MAFNSCTIYKQSNNSYRVLGDLNGWIYSNSEDITFDLFGDINGQLIQYGDGHYTMTGTMNGGSSGYTGAVNLTGAENGLGQIVMTGTIGATNVSWKVFERTTGEKVVTI